MEKNKRSKTFPNCEKIGQKEEALFNIITEYLNSTSIISRTGFDIIFNQIKEKFFSELADDFVFSIIVDILFRDNTFKMIAEKKKYFSYVNLILDIIFSYYTNLEELSNRIINFILVSDKYEQYPIEFIKIISIMQKTIPDIFYTFLERIKANNTQKNNNEFKYISLIEFFKNSHFYIFDQVDFEYQVHFKNQEKLEPLVLFCFLEECNNVNNYLLLYSNKVLLIYDLLFGSDSLTNDIFKECFQDFAIVPINEKDIDILSDFIDLSDDFFLNSDFTFIFNSEQFRNILIENLNFFNIKMKNECIEEHYILSSIGKRWYVPLIGILIKLIIHYVPLIGVVTDNFQLSPSNFKSKELPKFNENEFETITTFKNFISIILYKKTFEIYLIKNQTIEFYNDCEIELYEKIYNKFDESLFLPCYGKIEFEPDKYYLLFKFFCNKEYDFNKLNNMEKSSIIYNFLCTITMIHECGFYIRNLIEPKIYLDKDKKSYYIGYNGLCHLNNIENDNFGHNTYMNNNQYSNDKSSPLSDVYSYLKIVNFLLTGKSKRCKYYKTEYDEFNLLFDNYIREYEEYLPDSLILFIQMHEQKNFLPNTNLLQIDSIFNNFFEFFIHSGIKGGKYITSWSQNLENNQFKNLILKNLPLTFIVNYSYTEFECKINKILNNNLFQKLEDEDIFKLNFFAEILNNQLLKIETDEKIKFIPKEIQIIRKLVFYENLNKTANEEEKKLINKYYEKEKNNFSENFEECIKQADLFPIEPSWIHFVFNEKDLKFSDSHHLILYLLKNDKSFFNQEECLRFLLHFDNILYDDVCKLDSFFNTRIFSTELKNKIINKPASFHFQENKMNFDKIENMLNSFLDNAALIENDMNQEDTSIQFNVEEKQKTFVKLINQLEKEQNEINIILNDS